MKKNCWEFKKCSREPGGGKVEEFGVCPVTEIQVRYGTNSGTNGGRCCWRIAGTFCGSKVQGTYAQKLVSCLDCDFFKLVKSEEGGSMKI